MDIFEFANYNNKTGAPLYLMSHLTSHVSSLSRIRQLCFSLGISMKHMVETTMLVELWNGQNSWSTFISRNPPQNGIWFNYLFSWNKTSLDIFLNGVLLQRKTTPSSNRHSLLTPFASNHSTRLSIGRSSSTGSNSKVKMQFDDLKIWERPLNETEALQVYQLGELE